MSNAATFLRALSRKEFTELVRQKSPWLRRTDVAAYLGVSVSTVEAWRASGKGPAFVKNKHTGMVRHHIDVLDAFMNTRAQPGDGEK